MEEVWIKNEPVDVDCHIKCEEEISIVESEPSAAFTPSDTASIKSEISLVDYSDIPPLHRIAVESTKVKKRNSRVHSTEKVFSCEECGWKFARKHNLKIHQRRHTGMWQIVINLVLNVPFNDSNRN